MPWKNGLGVTEEVIAYPPGSDIATFGWRLSIAHVGADGPFSVFAGIDRTIALLDGDGLLLDLPDATTIALDPASAPFSFSGDLAITSRNRGGPTIDLNIMTRRGQFAHVMRRVGPGPIEIVHPGTILVFNSPAMLTGPAETIAIERFDAVIVDPNDGPVVLPDPCDALAIEITSVQS